MKNTLLIFLMGILSHICLSQVGLNTETPDESAILDMVSTTQGIVAPRLTTEERNAIANPAAGLIVYDRTLKEYIYYNGTEWIIPKTSIDIPAREFAIAGFNNRSVGTSFNAVTAVPSGIVIDSGDDLVEVSGNNITFLKAGKYLIKINGTFIKTTWNINLKARLLLLKNGTNTLDTFFHTPNLQNSQTSRTNVMVLDMEAEDYLTLQGKKDDFTNGDYSTATATFGNITLEIERLP